VAERGQIREPPAQIGPYEIHRLLGRGATASVYECRHLKLGRMFAVKSMHPHLASNEVATTRFLREGRAVSLIVHPNVIEIFDIGEHDGVPYLVMSLACGEDLGEHLRRHGPMSVADTSDCILPVISAVAAAHEVGVVHRDLKPSNIRVVRDRSGALVPKVLDFGISKMRDELAQDLTHTDGVLGTASYMSPEQLQSARQADARSDVYALGVILYQCVTGQRPFQGNTVYDLIHTIMTAPVRPPSDLRPEIPPEFDGIVLRAMRRARAERFESARDLGRALAPFASERATWLGEFASGSTARPAGSVAASADVDDPSFTLVSGSQMSARAGSASALVARILATALTCAILVGMLATVVRRAGTHTERGLDARTTEAESVSVPASTMPAGRNAAGVAPEAPDLTTPVGQAPSGSASEDMPNRREKPVRHDVVVPGPAVTASARPKRDEVGTNGAPILE
jgi:eukaryotic-like serine/threonine-protein kinase